MGDAPLKQVAKSHQQIDVAVHAIAGLIGRLQSTPATPLEEIETFATA